MATPLAGGPEGPEGKQGPEGKEGKAGTNGANGEQGLTGTGNISCRLATAAALPAYTRVGNVYTANANGALPNIDGVAGAVNDFVLLTKGAAGADNGPLKITSLGSAGSKWTMERIPSMDASAECVPGMLITVAEGTRNGDRVFQLTTDATITLNTTALTFTPSVKDFGLVTELPTAKAIVGDLCHYWADKATGTTWPLIYTGEGELPWSANGDPTPLFSEGGEESVRKGTAYADPDSGGASPSLKNPLKGDYFIEWGNYGNINTAGGWGRTVFCIGTTSGSDSDALIFGVVNDYQAAYRRAKKTNIPAGETIKLRFKTSGAAVQGNFGSQHLSIRPIRVG